MPRPFLLLTLGSLLSAGCGASDLLQPDIPPPQGIRVVDPRVVPTPRAHRTSQLRFNRRLARKRQLIHDLKHGDNVKRAHAAFWLGEMHSEAEDVVPLLVDSLSHSNIWVRRASARALGKIGSPRAVKPLVRALGDPNRWVRNSVVIALRKIDTQEARTAVRGHSADG